MLSDRLNEEWPFRGMYNKIVASALKAQITFILRDTKVESFAHFDFSTPTLFVDRANQR